MPTIFLEDDDRVSVFLRELELNADGHALSLRKDDVDIFVPGLVRDVIGFGESAFPPHRGRSARKARAPGER